jgi:hypothetical protein
MVATLSADRETLPTIEEYRAMLQKHPFLAFLKEGQTNYQFVYNERLLNTESDLLRMARIGGFLYLKTLMEHIQQLIANKTTGMTDMVQVEIPSCVKKEPSEFDLFKELCDNLDFAYRRSENQACFFKNMENHQTILRLIKKHTDGDKANPYSWYWEETKKRHGGDVLDEEMPLY